MRRKLNVKLVASVLGALLLAASSVHFLHGYQLRQNAYRLLERGDRAVIDQEYDKALTYYGQYLTFVPNDVDTVQKYVEVLDRRAVDAGERVNVVLKMEQVLRVKPNEHALRLRLVHNLIGLDRVAEAIDHLGKLRGTWPDPAEIWHMLGWCQEAKKDYTQAIQSLEEAIRLKPTQLKSYAVLVEVYQDRLSQPDEAARVMDAMVRANADSYEAYLLHARFERRRGNDKAAADDLGVAYRLGQDRPEVILEVADSARARGNWAEATRLLQDGLKRFPDQADFYQQMAWVKMLTDQPDEAIALLKDGSRHTPKSSELATLLVDVLIDQQRYQEARAQIDELLKASITPTLRDYLNARRRLADAAILVHEARGRHEPLEEARRKLNELESIHKNWPRVSLLLGAIEDQEGHYPQAIERYTRALERGESQARVLVRLLELLIERREFDKAEAELAKYEQKRRLTKPLSRLGAEIALGQRDKTYAKVAVKRAEDAVPLPARDYRDALWLAHVYQSAGEFAKAESLLQQMLKDSPHAPDVWLAWLDHLAQTKQPERGLQELDRLKTDLPRSLLPLTIARGYEALRLPDQADKAYQLALQGDANFLVLAFAADFYRRADRDEEARKWYARLLDADLAAPAEYTAPARRHLAILLASRDPSQALVLLDVNQKLRGDTLADQRVRFYVQSLRPAARPDALAKFEASIRQQPPTPEERLLIAQMLDAADLLDQARAQLAEAVDEVPTPRYLVRYIHVLSRLNDLDEAGRQLLRLETLEPESERVRGVRHALGRAKKG